MNLNLDGKTFEPQPGQRLLDLVREAGMDTKKLSDRPIAAKIAGEVFTLNYIPVRQQDLLRKALDELKPDCIQHLEKQLPEQSNAPIIRYMRQR